MNLIILLQHTQIFELLMGKLTFLLPLFSSAGKPARFAFSLSSFLFLLLITSQQSLNAQAPTAGMKANGKIMNAGDTINVCIGNRIVYEGLAQGGTVSWKFHLGNPPSATGNGTYSVLYSTAGIDSTIQTVISNLDTASMYVIVKVNDQKPKADFTFTHPDSCGNVAVSFNSSSSSGNPDPLTYSWNFGDTSGTSTAANPSYQFLKATGAAGNQSYNVKLVVTNPLGCSDSITKPVVVKRIPDATLGNPDNAVGFYPYNGVQTFARCVNSPGYFFSFTNKSSTLPINTSYKINWGDNSPDSVFSGWTNATITHLYTIGQHTLTLSVIGSSGCIGIKQYNIFLGTNPAGGFASPGNTDICAPGGLNFIISGYANNTIGTTYTIAVNDGTSPVTYAHPPPDTVTHFFGSTSCGSTTATYSNSFSATLIIANPCLTTSVDVKPIFVSTKPRASMAVSPSPYVCTNSTVSFFNTSSPGNTVASAGQTTTCTANGKQLWSITPSTGYTITFGSLGNANGNPSNSNVWTNGSSSLSVVFNTAGTYTIKLNPGTDRCGVDEVVKTICVRNPPQASFTMDKHKNCGTDTVTINNTSPVGGCLGDAYSWNVLYNDQASCNTSPGPGFGYVNGTSNISKNPQIRFVNPGRYIVTLTVTANGATFSCPSSTFQDTFYVKAKPKAAINTINAVCLGNTISPTATVANCYGDSSLTYLWSFESGTPQTSTQLVPGSIGFSAIGSYNVALDVGNECGITSVATKANITSTPVANAGRDTSVCSGVPVKIGAPSTGFTYQWSPSTGLSSSTSANPTATLTYSGANADTSFTYIVTASAGANCSGKDTVVITVRKKPVVIVTPSTAQICFGSSAQLVATGADSYIWSPATGLNKTIGDTVVASPAATQPYTVSGTANGCSSNATATVSVIPYPITNAGTDTTVCNTSTAVQLTGTPAGGTWSGSTAIANNGVFNASSAGNGTYTLVYTASNSNCSKSDTMIVTIVDPPVANAGNDTTVCQSTTTIQLKGLPVGGRWSGSASVTSAGVFTPSVAGVYKLVYTIGFGTCTGRDTMVLTVAGGINNNIIANDQGICSGSQPAAINGQDPTGGNGAFAYKWQSSIDNITWNDIAGASAKDYTPGILTQTTYFRRLVSTTLCNGPQSSTSNVITITINPDATASFNPTVTKGCVPFNITPAIINLTAYNSVGEYRWYVNGNYIGSGQSFPGYTMNNPADSITIKLVTISKFGCKNDSMQRGFVTVERPVPSYRQTDTVGCGPLAVTFTNTTPNASRYNYVWNFGNGQTSTSIQPGVITFATNPNNTDTVYTVTMRALSACDTIVTTSYVRVKSKPKALFTPDKSEGCSPMKVTFSNTSRGTNVSYVWNFGDGSAPLSTNAATVQHTFTVGAKDTFKVKLIATNSCGSDTLVYAIVVNPNSIRLDFAINGNERYGCAPHTVKFINNTTGANSFTWTFGDGTTLNTTKGIDTISHTYTTAGNYNVLLFASNSCNDTTDTEPVTVQLKPSVSFTAPLSACISDTVRFTNTSSAGVSNTWSFGDGTTSFVRSPAKVFTAPGTYRVLLIGSNVYPQGYSCVDSAFSNIIIRDTLPGDFIVSDTASLCLPFTVTFKNVTRPSQTTWSFGDGSTATGDSVTHTYTTRGSFIVKMSSRASGGCVFSSTKKITVNSPTGTLTYNSGYVCIGNAVRLEIKNGNASQYRFVFDDGDSTTSSNAIAYHQYTKPGMYIPYAYLIEGNCKIKLFVGDTVKADKVTAGFRRSMQFNCGATTVQFTDTSNAFFGIASKQWSFGDGTTSSLQNPLKTYMQNGTYYVRLQVNGASGCIDTTTVAVDVAVRSFPASAIGADSIACTGQVVNLAALVQSKDSIANLSWTFGNGITGSGKNVTALYNVSGIYTVRLITTTIYGCADTAYKTIKVNASPVVNAGADVRICRGQSVQLQAFGATTWQWTPLQDLSCSSCANPVANPTLSTQYVVRGTNNLNCSVTDTVVVNVVQPFKLIVSANDTICVGSQTQLFASGATTYLWNPVSGLSNGTIANPIANPTTTTQYRVIGGDPYNCFADTAYVSVAVGNYPTVDLGTGTTVVAGTNITMNPILTNGPIKSYTWTPAINLSCSDCRQPVATINNNITYKLEVQNIYGCKASDTIIYKVTCEEASQVYIPNAFSPDGDGLNDVFMVRGRGIASVKYLRVFNRWGQLVFEKNNFNANDAQMGWDGRVNGITANPDVYVYTAEMICTAGSTFIKKGNVTLVR